MCKVTDLFNKSNIRYKYTNKFFFKYTIKFFLFIQKIHLSAMKEKHTEQLQQNSTRKNAIKQSDAIKHNKKPCLQASLTDASASGVVGLTQVHVDDLIFDFVIEDMQSLL